MVDTSKAALLRHCGLFYESHAVIHDIFAEILLQIAIFGPADYTIANCDKWMFMHVITQKRIWEAKRKWPQCASALDAWYRLIKCSEPRDFAAMKGIFPAVDKVGQLHVFDIGGNKIRLIANVHYKFRKVYIRAVLDHKDYDKGKWREA